MSSPLDRFLTRAKMKLSGTLRMFGPEDGTYCGPEPLPQTEEGAAAWLALYEVEDSEIEEEAPEPKSKPEGVRTLERN